MQLTNVLLAIALAPSLVSSLPADSSAKPLTSDPTAANATTSASSSSSALKACLQQYPFEQVYAASSNYATYSRPENENLSYKAFAIALPSSVAGASDVVKCVAAQQGTQKLAVRGGHHSYAAYDMGGGDGWTVLDLRKFNSISIDSNAKTATVGAGVRLGTLAQELAQAGYALPHGTCAYVGVSGHGLGGGYGFASRKWGFLMDHIVSMQIILPTTGEVVTASPTQNTDLFWGLRGGGQNNFGAVLSFTYALETAPTQIVDFSYGYRSNSDCVSALLALQDMVSTTSSSAGFPADLTAELLWITESAANGGPACTLGGQHIGATRSQHDAVFQRFRDAVKKHGGSDYDASQTTVKSHTTWANALADDLVMGGFDVSDPNSDHEPYYAKSLIQPEGTLYTKDTATSLMNLLNEYSTTDGTGNSISFAGFGPLSLTNNLTLSASAAYPHRDTLFLYQFYSYGTTTDKVRQRMAQLVDQAKSISSSAQWGGYVNYIDRQLQEWANAYYGSALTRLKSLKSKYDPNNIFDYAQGLAHA
ncbi:FAD-binding domain-containing protein [Tilletiaria anomala UBC 951]|uniref:FAD-binding domain-containing protein n=1 Tax=Tilletiaria anomala (strain ATCC 24038 / CBS 436.72 / UBC 951) TaxID=1037660 RepID=A0A066VY73_TILAU|nr:FAD-binding domain-containing protein [Tilletiaria anomala UBC 951]KDN43764.1 FAD-binding domain-containing protein [Tilletiaria anomala UBC 951]